MDTYSMANKKPEKTINTGYQKTSISSYSSERAEQRNIR